jgi:hypothetical protein
MKKFRVLTYASLILVIALTILSFIKLPVEALTSERIEDETSGLFSLNSSERQSLLILPSPKIEMINSVFALKHNSIEAEVSVPTIELSRSLFDKNNISIQLENANLQNITTNLVNNSVLLEDEVENLNLKIVNTNNLTRIESNKFKYKGASISFDAYVDDSSLKKLIFSIDGLEIDELVLLLDEKYQKFLKQISFSTLDLKGEYLEDTLVLDKFELNLKDDSKINLLGIIDIQNILNSDFKISGSNITSKNIIKFIDNLYSGPDLNALPEGILKNFNIDYNEGMLKESSFSYQSNLGTSISVKGLIKSDNIFDSNLNIELTSTSSEEIFELINNFNFLDKFSKIEFDQLKINSTLNKGLFKIDTLNVIDGESNATISGEIDIYNKDNRNLEIKLTKFNQFNLFPFPQLEEILTSLDTNYIDLDCFLTDTNLEIVNLEIPVSRNSNLNITGEVNLKNFKETFLNIKFNDIKPFHIKTILDQTNQLRYLNYIELINFEEIQGSIFLDLKENSTLINGIEFIQEDNVIGNISGEISNSQFKGSVNFEKININQLDKKFFKTKRIKGFINVDLVLPNFISPDSYLDIGGTINGDIEVVISDDELGLLMFMQSLSQDIEDFSQVNVLLGKLSRSFVNQSVTVNGNIDNKIKNKFIIKKLTLTAPNGDNLLGEFDYSNGDYKITIFDVIDEEDLVVKFKNGSYSYERIIPDGTIKKPIEELIQKNINKLFENLLQ